MGTLKHWHNARWLRLLRAVLTPLWPIVLIGGWAAALEQSVFSRDGFFAQIYAVPSWCPGFTVIHEGLAMITAGTLGLLGLAVAVTTALKVAGGPARPLAGLVAGSGFLLLHVLPQRAAGLTWSGLGERGVLFGCLFGALCGWFVPRRHAIWRAAGMLITVTAWRLFALHVIKGTLLDWLASLTLPVAAGNGWGAALVVASDHLLSFLGLPTSGLNGAGGTQATANLSAALSHGLATVPYRYTLGTIYAPFATFGGLGATLGLLLAMLLVGYRRRRAWGLVGPSLVNVAGPALFGVPVLLEPVLLIPYLLAPAGACLIAWAALRLHLMVPAVYQVPPTTPGFLQAWLATNGTWPALLVSLLCLAWCVAIYWPFVRVLQGLEAQDA